MSQNKKPTRLEIFMFVCCAIGITLMVMPKFIDTSINLAQIGYIFNGIGIFALLRVMSDRSKINNE